MRPVRCSVCRRRYININKLIAHVYTKHSKFSIIKYLIKKDVFSTTPNLFSKNRYSYANTFTKRVNINSNSKETETMYLSDDFHILCGQNQVIIGDTRSSVDMEFSFDESSCHTQYYKNKQNKHIKNQQASMRSPSVSSEGNIFK